jgi:hypothetical protein
MANVINLNKYKTEVQIREHLKKLLAALEGPIEVDFSCGQLDPFQVAQLAFEDVCDIDLFFCEVAMDATTPIECALMQHRIVEVVLMHGDQCRCTYTKLESAKVVL